MHLYALPLIFALIGLALYVVLSGADFGAGLWQLLAGTGSDAEHVRDHAHHAIGPVWEANHVWLIFVLTVIWTAYPIAFGSIASTLELPLFIAGLGIILRGATYALRSGARSGGELRVIDTAFAISSILTPFALGAAVGAVAAGRVPVGNAAGRLISSWTGPVSILIGVLAVAASAYLAAVFLSADAARLADQRLEDYFRRRAMIAGVIAGGIAFAGLIVLHGDAHRLFHRLVAGAGLAGLIVSALAGLGTLGLVAARRYEAARYTAAVAVAAIIAGWALAQQPILLPGLTIAAAAAPHDTQVLVVVAVLAGAVILFPSLAVLFRLVLRGRFDPGAETDGPFASRPDVKTVVQTTRSQLLMRGAGAGLIAGFGLLTVADGRLEHLFGVVCLLAFVVLGVAAAAPVDLAAISEDHSDPD
jgi:cytochrome d ubiquinol oxidase subunit II